MKLKNYFLILLIFLGFSGYSQEELEASVEGNINNLPVREYKITIDQEMVVKAKGKETMGMTINGGIPGPVLEFTEGEYAVIYVENKMDVETKYPSIARWHKAFCKRPSTEA